jgi:hypothetical protein
MGLTLSAQLAIAFLLFVAGLAVLKGRLPEKIGGIAVAVNEALYLLVYRPDDNIHAQWEAMVIDTALVAVLAFIAIRWDRTWAKYAAAFELLIVGTHLATAADLRIATYFAYWSAAFWTIATLWALLFGTIQVILQDRRAARAVMASPPT